MCLQMENGCLFAIARISFSAYFHANTIREAFTSLRAVERAAFEYPLKRLDYYNLPISYSTFTPNEIRCLRFLASQTLEVNVWCVTTISKQMIWAPSNVFVQQVNLTANQKCENVDRDRAASSLNRDLRCSCVISCFTRLSCVLQLVRSVECERISNIFS